MANSTAKSESRPSPLASFTCLDLFLGPSDSLCKDDLDSVNISSSIELRCHQVKCLVG